VIFLDDVFVIWTYGAESLTEFFNDLNSMNSNLKFTYEISHNAVNYLDVKVHLKGNKLETELYRKPTDAPSNLHYSSSHPKYVKRALPYSEALRVIRICSTEEYREKHLKIVKLNFLKKLYPVQLVLDAIERAKRFEEKNENKRESQNQDEEEQGKPLFLVRTYHDANPNVANIFSKHMGILNEKFDKPRYNTPIVSNRRPPNIANQLVHSKYTEKNNGSRPCESRSNCKMCCQMPKTTHAKSRKTEFKFEIRGVFDCHATNVVYLLECSKCKLQYIGETIDLRKRINNHRSHCLNKHDSPLYEHRLETGHSFDDFNIVVLKGNFANDKLRGDFEKYAISMFDTFGNGLNKNEGGLGR
jgi:hypothetical protein